MKDWSITRWIAFLVVGSATWWTARQCGRGAYLMLDFTANRFIQTMGYFVVYLAMLILIFIYVGIPVMAFIEAILTPNNKK